MWSARLTLTQTGRSLSGSYSDSDLFTGSVTTGQVWAPNNVRFTLHTSYSAGWYTWYWDPTFTCTLSADMNTCTGTCQGCNPAAFTWTRQ